MAYMYKLFWRSLITTWNWPHSHINFYNEDKLWLTCHPRGCNNTLKCFWPTFTQRGLNFDHKLYPEDPNKYDLTVLLTITAYMWHLDYPWYLGLCGYTHAYFRLSMSMTLEFQNRQVFRALVPPCWWPVEKHAL